MKNEAHTHLQISWNNADKWEQQQPGCAVFIRSRRPSRDGTCLSCPITIQQPAVLEASLGRSQIMCRLVIGFKVKQQLSSQLFHRGIFRPNAGELEIGQNYGMDWPRASSPIYLHHDCLNHLGNTSACTQFCCPLKCAQIFSSV